MTIGSLGMICNLFLILIITIDPLKILRRGAWLSILNLSIADFITCGVLFVQLYLYQMEFQTLLNIRDHLTFFWMFGVSASFILLTLLSIQTYIAVKYPIESRTFLTTRKVVISCIIAWIMAVGLGISDLAFLWTELGRYFQIGNIAVLELFVSVQVVLKMLIIFEILNGKEIYADVGIQIKKQKEIAKTVMIVTTILIFTAFPYFLAKQIELIDRLRKSSNASSSSLLQKFPYYYEPVALLNFVVNPVVYSLRLQDYRRSFIALFKSRRRRHSSTTRTMSDRQYSFISTDVTKL